MYEQISVDEYISFLCSVMGVKFVRNTHYMFSVGKDRVVKYRDADKFELSKYQFWSHVY